MNLQIRGVVDAMVENDKLNDELAIVSRRSLIVYFYSMKQINTLRRYGSLQYVSRKMKYAVLYVDDNNIEDTMKNVDKLHFVRSVVKSYRPDVEMNFAEKIGHKPAITTPEEDDGFEVAEVNTRIVLADHL